MSRGLFHLFSYHLICFITFQLSDYLVSEKQKHGQTVDVDSDEHKNTVKGFFEHTDKDRNGVISKAEFTGQ